MDAQNVKNVIILERDLQVESNVTYDPIDESPISSKRLI